MAEQMEKPPPYAPPASEIDPKSGQHYGAYDIHHGGGPQPPPGFVPPMYQPHSDYPPQQFGPQMGPSYPNYGGNPGAQTMGQNFPNYGSTVYVHQPPQATQIIVVGGCPSCRIGVLEDDFTCLGILLAVLCFPIGLLCCLAMRQRRCPNCGAIFG